VSISPPSRDPEASEKGLHWDTGLESRPVRFGVQGVLYLTDTPAEQGAFVCVPGFHRRIEDWLDDLPPEADPKEQDLLALGTRRIAAEAGDLIIWHVALPHTAALNRGRLPRVAQYITMSRAGDDSEEARQGRIAFWRDRLSGLGRYDKEREHHERSAAVLTPLGRKLAGVDPWGQDSG
jgi:ectoine hydroxylase-related dioxygenase (phytanoyl-CoA dioxygenase family)